jgi:DNA-binding NtrC family response regulator
MIKDQNLNLFLMERELISKAISKFPKQKLQFYADKLCIPKRTLQDKLKIHGIVISNS